ncbi:MAG: endonuclease/exonuclease/phosphatase family protein [Myxococcota bacterium]
MAVRRQVVRGRRRVRRAARAVRAQATRAGDQATLATSRAKARALDLARRARDGSMVRVRVLQEHAEKRLVGSVVPHLCFVTSPRRPIRPVVMRDTLRIATYNVHRWQGGNGRSEPDVARAGYVISELDADVVALQEVLRPYPSTSLDEAFEGDGDDPLGRLCDELELHLAFAVTRQHRRGQLGNAILSRYPITAISVLDISYSRIERRGALAAQVGIDEHGLGVVATHLSLVDRTRHRQVQSLLEHPALNGGPAVLMGDMNAWRKCKGSQALEASLGLHHNRDWPATFPAGRPLLALDRIYTRQIEVLEVRHHDSPAARRASDHLPIVAEVRVGKREGADPES